MSDHNIIYDPRIPSLSPDARDLSQFVLDVTAGEMTKTGNKINEEHRQGLQTVTDNTALLYADSTGLRLSIDLFTGGGKTTTVAALLMVLMSRYDTPNYSGRGVLVCVGTHEQADELLRSALVSPFIQRINERKQLIGTFHAGESATIKSKAEAAQYPFVIVTHQRIRIQDWPQFINHDDRQRLVIWDEALVGTESKVVKIFDLMEEINDLRFHLDANEFFLRETINDDHGETLAWLQEIEQLFKEVKQDDVVSLPDKPEWITRRNRKLHQNELERKFYGFDSPLLITLLNESKRHVRVNTKSHAFWYVEQVPDLFKDILILDASTPIRKLVHMDESIIRVETGVEKDYSDVTIHYCRARTSRYALEQKGMAEQYQREIGHIVETYVPDEHKLLTFALKQKGDGLDHLADVATINDRVIPVSWGKSKGLNRFSGERYGTHCGMVYRERNELAVNAAGQKRDINFTMTKGELDELIVSEHADQVFQAISRLQNRKTVNLKALPTTFWLFYPDERIIELLKQVMPNVRVVEYIPKYVETDGRVTQPIVNQMVDYLKDSDKRKVSMKEIRKACDIQVKKDNTIWTDKVKPRFEAELAAIGWMKEGRSYVPNAA